jgi:hypothetical protein
MLISLRPPRDPLKSLFFEIHFPAEAHSFAIQSGEDPDRGDKEVFVSSTMLNLKAPCDIRSLGPSGLPPNLQVRLLSDRRNLVINGSNVDVHSTIMIWTGLYPYTPETEITPGVVPFHAEVNARATYSAYGQELPAKLANDRPWTYNVEKPGPAHGSP